MTDSLLLARADGAEASFDSDEILYNATGKSKITCCIFLTGSCLISDYELMTDDLHKTEASINHNKNFMTTE